RPERRAATGGPAGIERAPSRRSGTLAARTAAEALARQRSRQGDGLSAEALAGLHTLSRRGTDLPVEQRRRASAARHCAWQKIMAVRGIRPRRAAGGGDVQPDR